jgi:hypothetical protein
MVPNVVTISLFTGVSSVLGGTALPSITAFISQLLMVAQVLPGVATPPARSACTCIESLWTEGRREMQLECRRQLIRINTMAMPTGYFHLSAVGSD